jgi:hypothetical protein
VKQLVITILAAVFSAAGCAAHYHTLRNGHIDVYLRAPRAQSVSLVVSGETFEALPAARTGIGTWKVTLDRANEFTYFYLVDGKAYLPDCPLRERDDFGADNCVFSP